MVCWGYGCHNKIKAVAMYSNEAYAGLGLGTATASSEEGIFGSAGR